jgi:hypothetical protein
MGLNQNVIGNNNGIMSIPRKHKREVAVISSSILNSLDVLMARVIKSIFQIRQNEGPS